jgi:hypothetical protein
MIERLVYGSPTGLDLILGPPDTAKTQYAVGYIEWRLGLNPSLRVLVASEISSGIAKDMATEIADTIEANERYAMTFGNLKGAKWGANGINTCVYVSPVRAKQKQLQPTPDPPFPWLGPRGRLPAIRGYNVKPVGWRTGYQGSRCELLVGDDLVSDRSSQSQVITQAVFRTLHQKLLARSSGKGFRAILLGQCWAPRDLFALIKEVGYTAYDNNPLREGLEVLQHPEWDEEAV